MLHRQWKLLAAGRVTIDSWEGGVGVTHCDAICGLLLRCRWRKSVQRALRTSTSGLWRFCVLYYPRTVSKTMALWSSLASRYATIWLTSEPLLKVKLLTPILWSLWKPKSISMHDAVSRCQAALQTAASCPHTYSAPSGPAFASLGSKTTLMTLLGCC